MPSRILDDDIRFGGGGIWDDTRKKASKLGKYVPGPSVGGGSGHDIMPGLDDRQIHGKQGG